VSRFLGIQNVNTATIFKNVAALGFVQVTNYLLPLLTLPYIIQKVGIENFGKISIAQAIILYLVIIPDYGFNFTTTAEVVKSKNNINQLSGVVANTLVAKAFLLIVAFVLLLVASTFSFVRSEASLFFWGFSIVIGQTFFPMWFFQGIEKMKLIALLNLGSRILLTILIFFLIHEEGDYTRVLPIYGFSNLVGSIVALTIVYFKFKLKLRLPNFDEIKDNLKNGFPIFISSLANNAFVNSGLIILGYFAGPTQSGYYAIVDKVALIFRQLIVIVGQALYPSLRRLKHDSEHEIYGTVRDTFKPVLLAGVLSFILLLLIPKLIVFIFVGESITELEHLIRIISPLPIFLIGSMLLNQLLLVYDFRTESMKAYVFCAAVSICINIVLAYYWQSWGVAINVIASEILLIGLFFYFIKTKEIFGSLNGRHD